jgi:tetratricopeptide (TPR) repeat protein
MALSNLGVTLRSCGFYARARACFDESCRIDQQVDDRRGEAISRSNLGLLEHLVGHQEAAYEQSTRALEIARDTGDRRLEGYALTHQAHGLLALGRLEEAAAAYSEAVALRCELGLEHLAAESRAGLARVHLAQGRPEQALLLARGVLERLESGGVDGSEEPVRTYWTCCQVLRASHDPQADAACRGAQRMLAECAERIHDAALRESFLRNVAAHREIQGEQAR